MAEEFSSISDELATSSSLRPIISQFQPHSSHGVIDIRESIALVDFHLKIVYTLVIAFSKRPLSTPIKIAAIPGFGSMLAVVRQGARLPEEIGTQWIRDLVATWSREIANAIDQFRPAKYKTFKTLRDRLSHGQPLPNEEKTLTSIREGLLNLTSDLQKLLEEQLQETSIVAQDGRVHIHKKKERATFELSPLWLWSTELAGIRMYSLVATDEIQYIEPNGSIWSERNEEAVTKFLKTYVGATSNAQTELAKLVREVVADIAAYTEDYSRPSYFFGDEEDTGNLYVPWTRSTSEENQSRIDAFRIGQDNRREWLTSDGGWLPYTRFLKSISNWKILARRISIGLDGFLLERASEESSRLGSRRNVAPRGPSRLKKKKDAFSLSPGGDEDFELMPRIDESCQRMKPSTSVYFLIGQAGLGKTDLMVSLAQNRAKHIEANPEITLPLYLFVSSSGRTLSSLENAVNSALNITKLLSSQSAKALCRNGLLVLLVDGFDELLGSSGYENALGSLEPWFRELGGRGVLVASARSSYYLTQYRRSLAQATSLNVDHTLVELQPWSKQASIAYLRAMGISQSIITDIKDRDWHILSVPFFAKAYAAWLGRTPEERQENLSIYEIVVEQYLEREAKKLTDPNAGQLLTANELQILFSEVAELMQSSKNRELEQSDLISCAEMVANSSNLENVKPGLTRRLSSLCGLGVSTDSGGQNQFGFSHEVLFDCFLSVAIQQKISGTFNAGYFYQLLGASVINSSVFEWLIEKRPEAVEILTNSISFRLSGKENLDALSTNLGSLWQAMLLYRNGVPATDVASGLQLEQLDLSKNGWKKLDLSQSVISELIIPEGCQGMVDVSGADISYLACKSLAQAKLSLKGVHSAIVHSVHIGDQYGDSPSQVRATLEAAQLIDKVVHEGNQEKQDAAFHFIDRLARRPDVAVILDREWLTVDDQRLSWINHFDAHLWRSFVDALVISKVVALEPIESSGRPKVRLSFYKPVASLVSTEDESQEKSVFWRQL